MFLNPYRFQYSRSISKETKEFIMMIYGFKCHYCGTLLSYETCHIDHAIPRSRHGSDAISNLRASCSTCNLEKGNKTEAEYKVDLAMKFNAISYLSKLLGAPRP